MNGFMVFGREQSFDAPLGLFEDREAALEFAEDVTESEVVAAVVTALDVAPEYPLFAKSVGLVEFIEGEPQPWEQVKEFEDQPQEAES